MSSPLGFLPNNEPKGIVISFYKTWYFISLGTGRVKSTGGVFRSIQLKLTPFFPYFHNSFPRYIKKKYIYIFKSKILDWKNILFTEQLGTGGVNVYAVKYLHYENIERN